MLNNKNKSAIAINAALCIFAICGVLVIYSFVKNIEYNKNVFYADAEGITMGVKYNERQQNAAKKAANDILDNNVKLRTSEISAIGDKIICYTKNVYIELDTSSMCPILLFYECPIGHPKLTNNKCKLIAMRFVLRNIPRTTKVNGAEIENVGSEGNAFSYKITFGDKVVFISVRADTGSIVYYDATMLF